MKVILDTHSFIWFDANNVSQLSNRAIQLLTDPLNDLILSVVVVWELVIKSQLGKLALRDTIQRIVGDQVANNSVRLLDTRLDHVYAVQGLPSVHKDPFDRLLVAQAIVEGAVLLTRDAVFSQYPIQVEW